MYHFIAEYRLTETIRLIDHTHGYFASELFQDGIYSGRVITCNAHVTEDEVLIDDDDHVTMGIVTVSIEEYDEWLRENGELQPWSHDPVRVRYSSEE